MTAMERRGAIGGEGAPEAAAAQLAALREAVIALSEGQAAEIAPPLDGVTSSALKRLAAMLKTCRQAADRGSDSDEARVALLLDLRAAIADDALSVAYQPKLNLRTGRIDSVEALARWRRGGVEEVAPDVFIALAEEEGDIAALTERVLRAAVRDRAAMAADGEPPQVSVNLSAHLLADAAFCRRVLEICEPAAGGVGIEITETAVIADPAHALANLHALTEAGIRVAIDDYGSGLSSLSYLKSLPAQELKIDKAFVLSLSSSHRDPLIVRSTIDLAHALDMQVTAEGVDDPSALALLSVMGCDHAQGFLISRPLPLPELQAFLRASQSESLMQRSQKSLFALRA